MPLHVVNQNEPIWTPSAKQQKLIQALLTYPFPSLQDAAKSVGVPYMTAKRWNWDQRFQAALRTASDEQWGENRETATRKLRGLVNEALRVKEEALHADLALAVKSADWILEHFVLPEKTEDMDQQAFEDAMLAAIAEVAPEVQRAVIAHLRRAGRQAS